MFKIINKLFYKLGKLISGFRNWYVIKICITMNKSLYKGINNVNFNPNTNGELTILKKLKTLNLKVFFDVGANIGEWTDLILKEFDDTKIYQFEVLTKHQIFLKSKYSGNRNIIRNDFGFSNESTDIKIYFNDRFSSDSQATAFPDLSQESEINYYSAFEICKVHRADNYLTEMNIENIDFLKIDVEGNELNILKGFGDQIKKVRIIQFEYGIYNIVTKDLLIDFFKFFKKYDYIIGKIFPNNVEFFEYSFDYENFLGANYIAVRRNDFELINLLKK